MGLLDDILPGVVNTAISVVGGGAVFRRTTTSFDATTNSRSTSTTDYPVTVSPPEEFDLKDVDGVNVLRGDFKVTVPALQLEDQDGDLMEPSPETDTLQFNGRFYRIAAVSPEMVGNSAAAYTLQCRK